MDDLKTDQLRALVAMSAAGLAAGSLSAQPASSLDQLARCGLFVVNCYAAMLLAEAEKIEAAEAKAK